MEVPQKAAVLEKVASGGENTESASDKTTSVVGYTDDAIIGKTVNGIITSWDKGAEKIYGYPAEEIVGSPINILVPPDYQNEMSIIRKKVENGLRIIQHETVRQRKNGQKVHVSLSVYPVLDKMGKIVGSVTIERDITELKKAEKAIHESEEKFRRLFEKSCDPTFLLDGDTFIDCNEAALKFMHCAAKEQLIGLHPFSISADRQPDGRLSSERVRELIDTTLREGDIRFEWKHRTFDSEDLWVDVSLTVIPIDGKQIIYTVWRNITERKRVEERLETEKQKFMTLIENAPFGTMLLDKDLNCTYMNAKFKELFGYDFEDVPDHNVWMQKAYPDPEYRSHVITVWRNEIERFVRNPSLREGDGWTFTVTCKDNRLKIVHFIPVQLPTGEYLKTYVDITEQKKAEEALKSREAELAIKSASLVEMNAALRVLLKEREGDRAELEEKIVTNVNKLIFPYINELKKCRLGPHHVACINIIERNLDDIVSPFLQKLGLKCVHLTPTEMRIANLVRSGKTTKEIGEALQMTSGTVSFYRNNIRQKLGLNNKKVNLTSYLLSL